MRTRAQSGLPQMTYSIAPARTRRFRVMCLAPKAHIHREPGAAPQDSIDRQSTTAESAIHCQNQIILGTRLNRAFSAGLHANLNSWGGAPGSNETAPLARCRYPSRNVLQINLL